MTDRLNLWAEMIDSEVNIRFNGDLIEASCIKPRYTKTGLLSGYEITIRHKELNETKHLSGRDGDLLVGKVNNLGELWTRKWAKEQKARSTEASKENAARLTKEAQALHERLAQLLEHTLGVNDAVDFARLKDRTKFPRKQPKIPRKKTIPKKPLKHEFEEEIGFFEGLFGRRNKMLAEQQARFENATNAWKEKATLIEQANAEMIQEYDASVRQWKSAKDSYLATQRSANEKIDAFKSRWEAGDVEAVEDYCRLVLSSSDYPGCLPSEYDVQFNPENGILALDFRLPSLEDIPTLTEVTFVATRGELREKHFSDAKRKQLFNDVCYQLCLRTIHELFEADLNNQIEAISFNGFVTQRSSATGKVETSCIMTLQTSKAEFLEIDLSYIEPKVCFKGLKGVGSANLAGITPIKPLLELDRSDSRFQEGYAVAEHLDETTNLASMDWVDFEHLVRELFEAEFSGNGGEVKVTQASADKGVDAVAFDPDPIRGGKIVIQAKRYTNIVGVSAVRDLFGTLMNEGANKGILVTTSDYGPDSYDFAKDKPITLINGANLLSLLERHGTKAMIDTKAAKAAAQAMDEVA